MSVQPRENIRAWGYEATGNYFETLGVQPLLGRFFGPQEDGTPGAPFGRGSVKHIRQFNYLAEPRTQ
jgi:hypothetical protein